MIRAVSEEELIELNALADGELEAMAATALGERIAGDEALRAAWETILATRQALGGMPRPALSQDFLARVEALADGNGLAAVEPVGAMRRPRLFAGWQNIAASVLLTALIASSATYLLVVPRGASLDELIASGHRRSLLAASPVDVLSSDRHTVKPWLDAKLGVSPPAPDLAAQSYPLIGGRVEVLGQQPVPALVYRHNEHTITLVAVPMSVADAPPADLASGGFNMVRWRGDGFEFRAVSDLEPGELDAFVGDYRAATAGASGK